MCCSREDNERGEKYFPLALSPNSVYLASCLQPSPKSPSVTSDTHNTLSEIAGEELWEMEV